MANEQNPRDPREDRGRLFMPIPAEYLDPIRDQKAFIIVFVLSAMITSLALTYVASDKYQSSTRVFYQPTDTTSLGQPSTSSAQAFGAPVPQAPFKIIGNTIEDVIKSAEIIQPVVLELNLHKPPGKDPNAPWYEKLYDQAKDLAFEYGGYAQQILKFGRIIEEDPLMTAMGNLAEDIEIFSQDSYIFEVRVRDKHPQRVAAIVDLLVLRLVEWLTEQDVGGGAAKRAQLAVLLDDTARKLSGLRIEVETLLGERDIVNIEQETSKGMEKLAALQIDRIRLSTEIAGHRATINELARRMSESRKARTQRSSTIDVGSPEDQRRMVSDKLFTEIELGAKLSEHASLEASISELQERLRMLPVAEAQLADLEMVLSALGREYVLLTEAHAEATVKATEDRAVAKVLYKAFVPNSPVAPIKIYHVGLAAGLSLSIAVGLVFLLTFLNIRVLFPSLGRKARGKQVQQPGTKQGTTQGSTQEASTDAR